MLLRETASILVPAPVERVALALEAGRDARRVGPDRFETAAGTFVLQPTLGGTRVVLARAEARPVLKREREDLRHRVEAELFLVRKLVEGA